MLRNELVNCIVAHYNLQSLVENPYLIGEGINKHYKIQTDKEVYSAKIINPKKYYENYGMSKDDLFNALFLAEKIAYAMQQNNIPTVSAILSNNGPILDFEDSFIILYPYIDGSILNAFEIPEECVHTIAQILAKMHKLRLKDFDGNPLQKKWSQQLILLDNLIAAAPWMMLLQTDVDKTIKRHLSSLADFISEVVGEAKLNFQNCNDLVITHNDLKPKNVIWDKQRNAVVIDWESAGYMELSVDLLDTLLVWCLEKNDKGLLLNKHKANIFLENYNKYAQAAIISSKTINMVTIKWVLWLTFCSNKILQSSNMSDAGILYESLEMITFLKENVGDIKSLSVEGVKTNLD